MKIPEEIKKHQVNYREGAWAEYTAWEYYWWIHNLILRAQHRTNQEKKIKDLTDARNYLLMWIAKEENKL